MYPPSKRRIEGCIGMCLVFKSQGSGYEGKTCVYMYIYIYIYQERQVFLCT